MDIGEVILKEYATDRRQRKILCIISAGSGCRISAKQEKIRLYQEFLRNQLAQVKKLWIRAYYQDLLERSENKRKKDLLELLADEKKICSVL